MSKVVNFYNNAKHKFKVMFTTIKYSEKKTLLVFTALALFGLLMIYSASSLLSYHFEDIKPEFFLVKQIIFIIMSVIVFLIIISFPFNKIIKLGKIVLILNVVSLIGVLIIGVGENGVKSWYDLGFITLQPVEFVKIGLIFGFAYYFEKNKDTINSFSLKYLKPKSFFKGIYFPIIYLLFITGLIMLQPDLGGAIIVLLLGAFMIATSGLSYKKVLVIFLTFITSFILMIVFMNILDISIIKGYQMDRINTWRNPFAEFRNGGYQVVHSLIAISSGGFFGSGLGNGIQKVGYIPLAHNDMIASNIAEELGLFGITILMALYLYVTVKLLKLAMVQNKKSQTYFLIGFASLIFVQMFVNLGGISGLIPLTGVTLPFISYGGSSIISLFIAVAIVATITARHNITSSKVEESKKIQNNTSSDVRDNLEKIEIDDL